MHTIKSMDNKAEDKVKDRIPFVYIVGWSGEGVYYIGSRTRKGCSPSDIGTTYFTSSKVVNQKWAETPPDIIQVLMTFPTKEAAIEFEHTALLNFEAHKTPQLLNQSVGGKRFQGSPKSPETRAKLSAAHKGKPGKPHPPETRAKLSAAHKGKPKSEEHRAKLSAANKGKVHSEETRAKLSSTWQRIGHPKGMLDKTHSLETRAKISEAGLGRKHSDESIQKMSKNNAMHDPSNRRKVSEALKGKPKTIEARMKNAKNKSIITPKGQFYSISEAARQYGVLAETITRWLKTKPDQFYLPKPTE